MNENRPALIIKRNLNKIRRLSHQVNPVWIGIASYLFWYLLFSHIHPLPLVDEHAHQNVILRILQGNFTLPDIPMLPGYHWIIAIFSAIVGASLNFSRFMTFLISAMAIVLYASILQQKNGKRSKCFPLLLAFLPILFPYTAMAYTDAVAVFFIIGLIWAQTKRLYILSALSGLIACLIRQSNMVWMVFIIAWNALEVLYFQKSENDFARLSRWNIIFRHLLPRVFGHIVALGCIGILLLLHGDVLVSDIPENRALW
jgi:hypothetical protein